MGTKVSKILISPEILNFMRGANFYITETEDILRHNEPVIFFQYAEPYQKHVVLSGGGRITCKLWNDEENAERFSTTLDVFKSNPSLHEWQLLMHVAGIIPISNLDNHLTIQNLIACNG